MDKSQLPYLLRLIDDPSAGIRAKIALKLSEFGSSLREDIAELGIELTSEQRRMVEEIIHSGALFRTGFSSGHEGAPLLPELLPGLEPGEEEFARGNWLTWLQLSDNNEKLEAALELLSALQLGRYHEPGSLRHKLDELAAEFRAGGFIPTPQDLCGWLFGVRGLRGSAPQDYYHPLNSNLLHVIRSGAGIPISLTAIFVLVGHRLHLPIHGCNFPGHFLARAWDESSPHPQRELFFDCYDGGRLLSDNEVIALRKAAPIAVTEPASAEVMIARFLRNLAVAYEQNGDKEKTLFMLSLLGELEQATGYGL